MLPLTSAWTTVLLAAAVALGPLAIDMYLPALPMLGETLNADTGQVQLTLSLYLTGFALAQLFCGPLADRYGRKPVMIGGFILFAIASVGCAFATDIETLQVLRLLQAIGGSAGPVLGRAAVRDIYPPRDAARILALLGSIMAIAPAVSPTLGGFLAGTLGWQSIFLTLALYALIMATLVFFAMPEPMAPENRQPLQAGPLLRNYRTIIVHPSFIGYTLTNSLIFSSMFAFLSGSAFVLIDFLGVKPAHFGFYFAFGVAGFITGNLLAMRLGARLLPDQILIRGLLVAVLAASTMAGLALMEVYTLWAVMMPQTLATLGVGMVLPQTMAGALASFGRMAGSASALFGFTQMAVAAGAGAMVGFFHDGTSLVTSLVVAGCAYASLASYVLIVRRFPAAGFERAGTPVK